MASITPDKFSEFYAKYPRREARKDAEKAWRQIDGDTHYDAIMAALEWQAPLFLERERHLRPLPATYLRGERWYDENPEAERQRLAAEKPKPAWFHEALANARKRETA